MGDAYDFPGVDTRQRLDDARVDIPKIRTLGRGDAETAEVIADGKILFCLDSVFWGEERNAVIAIYHNAVRCNPPNPTYLDIIILGEKGEPISALTKISNAVDGRRMPKPNQTPRWVKREFWPAIMKLHRDSQIVSGEGVCVCILVKMA